MMQLQRASSRSMYEAASIIHMARLWARCNKTRKLPARARAVAHASCLPEHQSSRVFLALCPLASPLSALALSSPPLSPPLTPTLLTRRNTRPQAGTCSRHEAQRQEELLWRTGSSGWRATGATRVRRGEARGGQRHGSKGRRQQGEAATTRKQGGEDTGPMSGPAWQWNI